jgi:hypothetical protein
MLLCPRLFNLPASLAWDQVPLFASALETPLFWQEGNRDLFRPGLVRMGWDESGLRIYASLEDDCVFTHVNQDNQRAWNLGDVFEIFVKNASREDYFEFHLTPNQYRLQLHFPAPKTIEQVVTRAIPLESLFVGPHLFDFITRTTPHGWEVMALLPTFTIEPQAATLADKTLRLCFGRYDYSEAETSPILSSSIQFKVLNFHCVEEWAYVKLV